MIKTLTLLAVMGCYPSLPIMAYHGSHQQQEQEREKMIQCEISMPDKVKNGEPVPLTFKLTNTSGHGLKILHWNTPFEGWFNRYLKVIKDGERVNYIGAMVKRFRPDESDYSTLAAGQSKQATVNVAEGYQMTVNGTYQLTYSGTLQDVIVLTGGVKPVMKSQTPYTLHCDALTVIIDH